MHCAAPGRTRKPGTPTRPETGYPRSVGGCRAAERHWKRVRAGLRPPHAYCLAGLVPAALACARWPLRAPRGTGALAGGRPGGRANPPSAPESTSPVTMPPGPGPDAWDRSPGWSWPVWAMYVAVLGLTCVVGVRFVASRVGSPGRRPPPHAGRHPGRLRAAPHRRRRGELRYRRRRTAAGLLPAGRCSRVVLQRGRAQRALIPTNSPRSCPTNAPHPGPPRPGAGDVHRRPRRLPRFVRSATALDAVRLLIELLADDAAVRAQGPA